MKINNTYTDRPNSLTPITKTKQKTIMRLHCPVKKIIMGNFVMTLFTSANKCKFAIVQWP